VVHVVVMAVVYPITHTHRVIVMKENGPNVAEDGEDHKDACLDGDKEDGKEGSKVPSHDDL